MLFLPYSFSVGFFSVVSDFFRQLAEAANQNNHALIMALFNDLESKGQSEFCLR